MDNSMHPSSRDEGPPIEVQALSLKLDPRGWVFEPVSLAELCLFKNVHVVGTRPGEIRGNHLHRRGTELVAVMGPALVRVGGGSGWTDFLVPDNEVYRFTFRPGTPHAIQNTGRHTGLLIAFNTLPHDPETPDVEPVSLIPPS